MKEIPMLFSTAMVQALLAGTKTETRRTNGLGRINENPNEWEYTFEPKIGAWFQHKKTKELLYINTPCQPGDQIWVREAFCNPNGDDYLIHKASILPELWQNYKWKPSLHMKKDDCRLWLKVTDARVERLHDLTDEGAINEGAEPLYHRCGGFGYYEAGGEPEECECLGWDSSAEVLGYINLWESINGKGSWEKNPYVWVITFKQIK